MTHNKLENVNIVSNQLLPTPEAIKAKFPLTPQPERTIVEGRRAIEGVLRREDRRLFLVVGPCAIHDTGAALEYADRLAELRKKVEDVFVLIMRVYFEKPRTTTGWKGLINDPLLDDSFRIDHGLEVARSLMLQITERGVPIGTEALDPIVPQYLADLVSWTAIGARTAESQTHREMSSGLSTPVGFKNGTDGNIQVAVNAVTAASIPHRFLGINQFGQCSVFHTRGNPYGHVVLRGGLRPNYEAAHVEECAHLLKQAGVPANVMVDCSHGNSLKDPARQPQVFEACVDQILAGNQSIVGMMIESNLHWGRQDLTRDISALRYGVSITDACIDWKTTEELILKNRDRLGTMLQTRGNGMEAHSVAEPMGADA